MPKETILTVKRRLADAFPGVAFTYGTAGRGRMAGPSITWTGGPPANSVQEASQCWMQFNRHYHFSRRYTAAEWAAIDAAHEAERPAREAAEAAAKAARREAGKAKSLETRKRTAAIKAKLAEAFPGTVFTGKSSMYGDYRPSWTDGPTRAEVAALLGIDAFNLNRYQTPAGIDADVARSVEQAIMSKVNMMSKRQARRHAQSKVRAIRVARAAARRACQPERLQLWLPFGPSIVAYNAAVFAGTYAGAYA